MSLDNWSNDDVEGFVEISPLASLQPSLTRIFLDSPSSITSSSIN